MTDDEAVRAWVGSYRAAWESNDPEEIGALFSDDAVYLPEPHAEPWRGRAEIVRRWLERKDEPGETTFEFEVEAVCDDLAFLKGRTDYRTSGKSYSNLWVVRLTPEGRASEYTEWWMERD